MKSPHFYQLMLGYLYIYIFPKQLACRGSHGLDIVPGSSTTWSRGGTGGRCPLPEDDGSLFSRNKRNLKNQIFLKN